MSLDVRLTAVRRTTVAEFSLTHNLVGMAKAAGLYECLWRPEEMEPPVRTAADLIQPLLNGLRTLSAEPERFKVLNPPNGYGTYEDLVRAVRAYVLACAENPDADVAVSR